MTTKIISLFLALSLAFNVPMRADFVENLKPNQLTPIDPNFLGIKHNSSLEADSHASFNASKWQYQQRQNLKNVSRQFTQKNHAGSYSARAKSNSNTSTHHHSNPSKKTSAQLITNSSDQRFLTSGFLKKLPANKLSFDSYDFGGSQVNAKFAPSADLESMAFLNQVIINDVFQQEQWALAPFFLSDAWEYTRGAGIKIAVIDSGVDYLHEDLAPNIWINPNEIVGNGIDDDHNGFVDDWHGWDFFDNDNDPMDEHGHGTHVAGIIAATQNNGLGISGIAPESKIIPIKIENSSGGTLISKISLGIRYAADMGAKIINMSIGISTSFFNPTTTQALYDAIQYARNLGAIVVVAAGNYAIGSTPPDLLPAIFDNVLTIGALRSQDLMRTDSIPGPQVDFAAPGTRILSLRASNFNPSVFPPSSFPAFPNENGKYVFLSGTSMATPFAAGVIALMLSRYPGLSYDDLLRRLKFSANTNIQGDPLSFGNGALEPFYALKNDYYANGVLKTELMATPVRDGVVQYDYDQTGVPTQVIFEDGSRTQFLEFWSTSPFIQKKAQKFKDGDLIKVYQYFETGAKKSTLYVLSGVFEEYLDENFYSLSTENGFFVNAGRLSRKTFPNGQVRHYLEYWPQTDKVKEEALYESGILASKFQYEADGQTIYQQINYRPGEQINEIIYHVSGPNSSKVIYVYEGESIQAAIDRASAGDTIFVNSGTYHEHLILKEGVSLSGADAKTTIIHGDFQSGKNVITSFGNHIQNFTISGSGPYNGSSSAAIKVLGNGSIINNCFFIDNKGYGILLFGSASATIQENLFLRNNVAVQLPMDLSLIQYNTFVDNGIGVNVLFGAKPTIQYNIFVGSTFQSIYEYAHNQASHQGYAVVNNNTFYQNAEKGAVTGQNLPPDVLNYTSGNRNENPAFTDPANGDYSISTNSPAYGRGAFNQQPPSVPASTVNDETESFLEMQSALTKERQVQTTPALAGSSQKAVDPLS